ncbi:hypothetical protein [Weissella cibaria]|uniref:hypothetical protein n=2 Tax=Weissella cibaria TaxID=137591 RepID=UPI0013DA22A5|nr:hypothetical protein [Weissella cibaria]MDQ2158740.1 hypothetical protein [Weissella cibaria]
MWFRRMRPDHQDNRVTRVYTDRQIDAVEYAIFGALFKGDFDRVRQHVRLALTNNPSLTNTYVILLGVGGLNHIGYTNSLQIIHW